MAKGDKVLLNPGFIANCVPVYEREIKENIRRNNEVCMSLGVKRITSSSVSLVKHKRSPTKTKRSNGELDDVDYRPQDDEDDNDESDSSDSFGQEIIEMPLGGRPPNSYPKRLLKFR